MSMILPVVPYDCETWIFKLNNGNSIRLFENRILMRMFGPKRNANEQWGRLHN